MATAFGLFDRPADAQRAVDELLSRSFNKSQIGVMADDHIVQGYRTTRAVVTGQAELDTDSAGGVLITVQAGDARAEEAQEVFRAAGAASVETRPGEWDQWGGKAKIQDSEPDEPETRPAEPQTDPLLDIETFKGGT